MFSSFYDWPLSATVLAGLFLPVWRIARKRKSVPRSSTSHTSESSPTFHKMPEPVGVPMRGMKLKWISARDFTSLLARFSDLIVIDLREGDQWSPMPVHSPVSALRVRNYELAQVLEHFPTNRVIVFFGVTDLSALIIEASSVVKGSKPIYFLDSQVGKEEVE